MPTDTKLPELPEGAFIYNRPHPNGLLNETEFYYTADQLRAYGDEREAYGRATAPAEVAGDERTLWGIVANAGRRSRERKVRWSHVIDATGQGSTVSRNLCRRFGFDPDETIGGHDEESDDEATRPAPGRDGFVIVPVEPTEAMVDAARRFSVPGYCLAAEQWPQVWAALIAAAQAPRSDV